MAPSSSPTRRSATSAARRGLTLQANRSRILTTRRSRSRTRRATRYASVTVGSVRMWTRRMLISRSSFTCTAAPHASPESYLARALYIREGTEQTQAKTKRLTPDTHLAHTHLAHTHLALSLSHTYPTHVFPCPCVNTSSFFRFVTVNTPPPHPPPSPLFCTAVHTAALKESLGAALLLRSGYDPETDTLCDPMCGSGTFAIEAALIATRRAPALRRPPPPLSRWADGAHGAAWIEAIEEAEAMVRRAPQRILANDVFYFSTQTPISPICRTPLFPISQDLILLLGAPRGAHARQESGGRCRCGGCDHV